MVFFPITCQTLLSFPPKGPPPFQKSSFPDGLYILWVRKAFHLVHQVILKANIFPKRGRISRLISFSCQRRCDLRGGIWRYSAKKASPSEKNAFWKRREVESDYICTNNNSVIHLHLWQTECPAYPTSSAHFSPPPFKFEGFHPNFLDSFSSPTTKHIV